MNFQRKMGKFQRDSIRIDYDRRDQNHINGGIWDQPENMPYYFLEKNYTANSGMVSTAIGVLGLFFSEGG